MPECRQFVPELWHWEAVRGDVSSCSIVIGVEIVREVFSGLGMYFEGENNFMMGH